MVFEMIGLGLVFGAASLAAMFYERRMDVLYGPYIEGCISDRAVLVEFLKPARVLADVLHCKARSMAYVVSVIAF